MTPVKMTVGQSHLKKATRFDMRSYRRAGQETTEFARRHGALPGQAA